MSKVRRESRKRRPKGDSKPALNIVAGVFLLALCVRGLYLYDSSDNPTFSAPVVDSASYDLMARDVVKGEGITREFFWQHFFYPVVLSIAYWLSGCSIVAAKVLQILLGSVTCVLICRLGERLFGRKAGIAAGVIAALYGPLIFFEAELLSAGWAAFWAVVLMLLLLKAAEERNLRVCFVLGLCGGLSVITRPNFIPFLLAAAVWLAVVWVHRAKVDAKRMTLGMLVVLAGFCAVGLPVAGKNYQVTGRFSFLPGTGGLNLYIGNNPEFEAVALRPGQQWLEVVSLPLKHGLTTPADKGRFFSARTLDYIRQKPIAFLKGLTNKCAQLTSSREPPGHIDLYLFRRWSPLLGLLVWKIDGFGFPFGVLLPLAFLGLLLHWRKVPLPVVLFLVLYPASVILTHVEARYRMPLIVPMCILAGAGALAVADLAQKKRWQALAGAGIFCVVAAIACSAAGPFYSEKHIDYEAELHYVVAGSYKDQGRITDAIESYHQAIGIRPDYLDAYQNLGILFVERKRLKEAVAHYERALANLPGQAGLHEGMGLALFEQGKTDEAIEQYERAIEIDPQKASVYDNLGRAYIGLDRRQDANENFAKALQLNPYDPQTHSNMGGLLAMQGEFDKAIEHFETSLKFRPRNSDTLNNLASALAAAGSFTKAVDRFEEALQIAPNDAGIYFNLAYCLQQQGRISEAIQAYRNTLALDPKNRPARQALNYLLRARP
ncbi:MAG: tetratricopeptide repeat protein [Planctomycetota bacterium]